MVPKHLFITGTLVTYGTNTQSGGNPRTIKLKTAPDGTQYLGFGSATNDTLFLFRSIDGGTSWSLFSFGTEPGGYGKGFDFFITDTTGGYRIGLILSVASASDSGHLSFFSFSPLNPLPLISNTFALPVSGRGLINPVIVSDGFYYSPSTTYWYAAYQDYSSSTPTANPVLGALTTDWGQTWTFTTVRSGFNDYDVSIEFNSYPTGDSVFVMLSNNLTLTNSNLRIRKVAVSNFTGTFSQFNPANTSDPEFHGLLKVNRITGEMICTFTRTQSGIDNIAYVYSRPGAEYFNATNPTFIAQNPYNEGGASVDCFEGGSTYRLVYLAQGPSADTVLYKWSFDLSSGFQGPIVINQNNNASGQIFPSVNGHFIVVDGSPDNYSGFVFAGVNQNGLYYNSVPDAVIPVELASFSAIVEGQKVHLNWQTATELNNRGFDIERKNPSLNTLQGADNSSWEKIGYVTGSGSSSEIKSYSFIDDKVTAGIYTYRLKQIDFDGSFQYSNEVEVNISLPGKFSLNQNYPNPFNPSTIISYSIPSNSSVRLELFSLTGEKLASLVNTVQNAGYYNIEFNSDILGISSGAYFYRLTAIDNHTGKNFIETKKLLLLK